MLFLVFKFLFKSWCIPRRSTDLKFGITGQDPGLWEMGCSLLNRYSPPLPLGTCFTSPAWALKGRTRVGGRDPQVGSALCCSRQDMRDRMEIGRKKPQEARDTRGPLGYTTPHSYVYPARPGGRTAGTRPPSHNPDPGRALGPRDWGGERPGWGRPGRKRRVPSAVRGAGGCSAAPGPRLPVCAPAGCSFPPELTGPPQTVRPYGPDPGRNIM